MQENIEDVPFEEVLNVEETLENTPTEIDYNSVEYARLKQAYWTAMRNAERRQLLPGQKKIRNSMKHLTPKKKKRK
jgi:hypothetical protein